MQLPHSRFAPLFSQLYRKWYAKSHFSYDAARIVFKVQKKVIHDTIISILKPRAGHCLFARRYSVLNMASAYVSVTAQGSNARTLD